MDKPVYFIDEQGFERCLVNPGRFPPVLLTLRYGEWGPPYSREVHEKISSERYPTPDFRRTSWWLDKLDHIAERYVDAVGRLIGC